MMTFGNVQHALRTMAMFANAMLYISLIVFIIYFCMYLCTLVNTHRNF